MLHRNIRVDLTEYAINAMDLKEWELNRRIENLKRLLPMYESTIRLIKEAMSAKGPELLSDWEEKQEQTLKQINILETFLKKGK